MTTLKELASDVARFMDAILERCTVAVLDYSDSGEPTRRKFERFLQWFLKPRHGVEWPTVEYEGRREGRLRLGFGNRPLQLKKGP